MRITALQPQRNRPDRVNVHLDGSFAFGVAAELALAQGLRVGMELSPEQVAGLQADEQAWKARQAAMNLLAVRPRSAAELRQRLEAKGFPPDLTERTVERLRGAGLVNDATFAESFVRDRVRLRPHGKRRLQQELRRKGVDPSAIREAIDGVMEDEQTSELELARRATARWRPRPGEAPLAARRRLFGFLARRGYGGDTARAILEERLGGGPPPDDEFA